MKARAGLWLALAIGLGVVALRAPLMDLPLERDEGGYAYIAWRLEHGEMPYRDWFDQKPPGVFLAYRAALALPGDPVVAIRLVAALFCALSCVALFALVRPLLGAAPAALAALLLGLLSADPPIQGPIANTELFMLAPMIAALAVLVPSATPSAGRSLAAGALLAAATLFKPVAAVNAPLLLLLVGLRGGRAGAWRRLLRFAAFAGLGALLVAAPPALWLWSRGALGDAIDVVLVHNLRYAGQLPFEARVAKLSYYASTLLPTQGPAWAAAALGLILLVVRGARLPAALLAGFAAANAVGVSASGLYFPHYFQQILPAVAALAAAAALGVPEARPLARRLRALAVGLVVIAPLAATAADFWRLSPAEATRRIYPGNPFEVMPAIAAEVAAVTQPDDSVFLFGAEPEIYFYARRASATRYIYLFPLYGDYPDVAARRREVIEQVSEAAPVVIGRLLNQMTGGRGDALQRWFRELAARHYRPHAVVVADPGQRGRVVRVSSARELAEAAKGRKAWAWLYVRDDAGS